MLRYYLSQAQPILTIVHVKGKIPDEYIQFNSEFAKYNNLTSDPINEIGTKLAQALKEKAEFNDLLIESTSVNLGKHWDTVPVELHFFIIYEAEKNAIEKEKYIRERLQNKPVQYKDKGEGKTVE